MKYVVIYRTCHDEEDNSSNTETIAVVIAALPLIEYFPDEIISLASGGKITLCMGNSLYAMPVLVTPIGVQEPAKHLATFPFVTGVEHVSTEVEEQENFE